jgi:hypothetical protein
VGGRIFEGEIGRRIAREDAVVELVVLLEPEPVELLVNDKDGRYVNVADDLLEICPEATEICHSITSELFVT